MSRFTKVFAKGFVLFALALVLAVSVFVGTSGTEQKVAHAAANGQQIKVVCNYYGLGNVYISGTNQNGQHAEYWGRSSNGHDLFVANWWWVGATYIQWQQYWWTGSGTWYVPKQLSGTDTATIYIC